MNETELRLKLKDLGIELLLDDRSERLALSEHDAARLTPEISASLQELEQYLIRAELYKASFSYLMSKLDSEGPPGLDAASIAAFSDDGRYEELADLWYEGSLHEFKRALKSCIAFAMASSASRRPTEPTEHPVPAGPQENGASHPPTTVDSHHSPSPDQLSMQIN